MRPTRAHADTIHVEQQRCHCVRLLDGRVVAEARDDHVSLCREVAGMTGVRVCRKH